MLRVKLRRDRFSVAYRLCPRLILVSTLRRSFDQARSTRVRRG